MFVFGCREKKPASKADAAPSAVASAPPPPLAPLPIPKLELVALGESEHVVTVFPLFDGVAVGHVDVARNKASVSTMARDRALAVAARGVFADRIGYVGGTSETLWVTTSSDSQFIARGAKPKPLPVYYRGVTRVGDDEWFAVTNTEPHLAVARGKPTLPKLTDAFSPYRSIMDSRAGICAVGYCPEAGTHACAWFGDRVEEFDGSFTDAVPVRTADGRCLIVSEYDHGAGVHPGHDYRSHIYGATPDGLKLVHEIRGSTGLSYFAVALTTVGDALWYTRKGVVYQVDLRQTTFDLESTIVPMPRDLDGCEVKQAEQVVAVAADDIWVVVSCSQPQRSVVLHSGAIPGGISPIPAP